MKKRAFIPITIVSVVAALAPAAAAEAHDATATPSCSKLTWNAHDYEANHTNSIVVTVNGTVVHSDSSFGSGDQGQYEWDQTISKTWLVVVNAPGTQYDRNFGGTQQACQQPTTTVAPTTTTTTTLAPTTTSSTTLPAPTTTPSPTTTSTSTIPVVTTTVPETTPSTSTPPSSTEPSTTSSTVPGVQSTTTVPSLASTTVATCTDRVTHEQTTDPSRCQLPPTGSSDRLWVLAVVAFGAVTLGLALLNVRRSRPDRGLR